MVLAPVKELTVYYEDIVGLKIQDRYELVHFVKAGGSSGVFAAYDRKMDRRVAVKLLPPTDPMMASRFEREAMTLSKLHHPNTLTVFDFGRTPDNYLYMVMELLEGETLKDVMRRDQWFAPRRAVHIIAQICRSLWNAHQHGVVHRDIKPSNIFLVDCDGDSEFVKVLDFGVAKLLHVADNPVDDGTQVGRIIGTPRYMAPEQISSEPVDARADMYSTGILLYEMLCGVTPFQESSLGPLLMLHLNEPPPKFDRHNIPSRHLISQELEVAVMRSLAKDPRDRYLTIDEMRVALETAVGGMSRVSMDGARLSARLGAAASSERARALTPAPPPLPDDAETTGNRLVPPMIAQAVGLRDDDDVDEALVLDDHAPDDDENRSTSLSIPLAPIADIRERVDVHQLSEPVPETLPPLTKTQVVPRATTNPEVEAESEAEEPKRRANRWLWAAAAALLVGASGAYFFLSSTDTAPIRTPVDYERVAVGIVVPGESKSPGASALPGEGTGSQNQTAEIGDSQDKEIGSGGAVIGEPAPEAPPTAVAVDVQVRVVSEPNEANVYRGVQRIGTTPFDLVMTETMWGEKLRFERPGYVTFEALVPGDVQQTAKELGKSEWVVSLEAIPEPVAEATAVQPTEPQAAGKTRDKKVAVADTPIIKPSRNSPRVNADRGGSEQFGGQIEKRNDADKKPSAANPNKLGQEQPKSPTTPTISTVITPVDSRDKPAGSVSGAPNVQIIDESVKPSAPKPPPAPKEVPTFKPNVPIIQ